jgi:hypothetical protein
MRDRQRELVVSQAAHSARRGGAQAPRRRRDAYIALQGDDLRRALEPLRAAGLRPERELALEALYMRITLAIVEDGAPLSAAAPIAAMRCRVSARAWRSGAAELEAAGCAWRVPAGGWMTALAAAELERRAARRRPVDGVGRAPQLDGEPPPFDGEPPPFDGENGDFRCDINGRSPPSTSTPPPTQTRRVSLPSGDSGLRAREAERAAVLEALLDLVAEHRGERAAGELLAAYRAWPPSAGARSPGAHARAFLASRGVHITPQALRERLRARRAGP